MSEVTSFLNSFVNRPEDTKGLIQTISRLTDSEHAGLFVRGRSYGDLEHDASIDHVLIAKYPLDKNTLSFHSSGITAGLHLCNTGNDVATLETSYIVHNLLIIPVVSNTERLGVICLTNSSSDYDEDTVRRLSPYICIAQLILGKQQIMLEYKKICDDDSFASKDLFLANMSHEIRTPLNGVIGYGQLLIGTEMTTTQRGYIGNMNQCSIQLMQIINDILDFSKLSSGKMKVQAECFPFRDVMDSVSSAMGQRLVEKRQNYSFTASPDVPEYIVMDKHKLIQVIINLLSNASKFTDVGGSVSITVSVHDKQHLSISVTDSGIGITDTDQCKLFNTFMQIESSTYKSGTGLGLAISRKLCELMGGDISVKSVVGEGSTFSFTFAYQPIEEFSKAIEADVGILKNKIILVVDDNADNRIVLSEILEGWDIQPVVVGTALEALRMVMSNRYNFDLGLIDICMPGTTGIELAKQIKTERPFFPLIALSSIDSFINTSDFECKLDKPINRVQLLNSICRVITKNTKPSTYIGSPERLGSSSSASPSERFNSNARILIAEDIEYNRSLLTSMLETLQYTNIDEAEDGQVAFDMIAKSYKDGKPYHILLLDIRMPNMDGYDVINAVNIKGWALPRIITITASVLDEDREKCASLGAEYFLNKPVDMIELKNVMLRVTDSMK